MSITLKDVGVPEIWDAPNESRSERADRQPNAYEDSGGRIATLSL